MSIWSDAQRRQPAMDAKQIFRTCPKCGSEDYAFRSRKKIEADPAKGETEQTETKYRCKACGEEWRVRVKGEG
jgi:DNA-directed RNA polymerase subunit M/transcription elongation factor TFIIS